MNAALPPHAGSTDKRGDLVRLVVATHSGHEYVKMENDGIQPDNLWMAVTATQMARFRAGSSQRHEPCGYRQSKVA